MTTLPPDRRLPGRPPLADSRFLADDERRRVVAAALARVAAASGLRERDLVGRGRHPAHALPRGIAMWICARLGMLTTEIGQAFGRRDHSTVVQALRRAELRMAEDESLRLASEATLAAVRGEVWKGAES